MLPETADKASNVQGDAELTALLRMFEQAVAQTQDLSVRAEIASHAEMLLGLESRRTLLESIAAAQTRLLNVPGRESDSDELREATEHAKADLAASDQALEVRVERRKRVAFDALMDAERRHKLTQYVR